METILQSLQTKCRACFNQISDSMFEIRKLSSSLLGLLEQSIGTEADSEKYPRYICNECHEKLEQFHEFHVLCRKTSQVLENLFLSENGMKLKVQEQTLKPEIDETAFSNGNAASESEQDFEVFSTKEDIDDIKSTPESTELKDIELEFTKVVDAPKPVHKCKICHSHYASKYSLSEHLLTHQEKRLFSCEKCDRSFNKKCRLKNHIEEMHGERPFEIVCRFGCGKVFRRHCTAANHYREKHQWNAKALKDPLLMNASTKEEDPDYEKNISSGEEIYSVDEEKPICGICQKSFTTPSGLRNHMWVHKEKRKYPCSECERSFNKKMRLKKHIEEIHSENPVRILCKLGCGKIFRSQKTAENHYCAKHSTNLKKPTDNSCVCEDCGLFFNNAARLREHSYHHRPVAEWPFKCDQCCKVFAIKSSYERHQMRHAGIKNYECEHCGARKTSAYELRIHVNLHTKNTLYCCDFCQKEFSARQNLRRHRQLVHEGIKKYQCTYCDQSFGKNETLKFHIMTHTGERPSKCPLCPRSFIQPAALKAHLKTHDKGSNRAFH